MSISIQKIKKRENSEINYDEYCLAFVTHDKTTGTKQSQKYQRKHLKHSRDSAK